MKNYTIFFIAFALMLMRCSDKKSPEQPTDEQLQVLANELAHKFIIADGHVDLPERLKGIKFTADSINTVVSTKKGDFDFERAKKGGLSAPFMSIYIPSSYQKNSDSGKSYADSLIRWVDLIAGKLPDKFALAKTPVDVEANFKSGKISLPKGMENGAPIGNDLKNVKYFYDRGVRYITLTHSKNNQICDSSGDTTKWGGLSPFGKEVVAEMNRVGIMIDISHVDDSTFYQVMKLTKAPCIASHSSCRYFAPSVRRDMTDDMIKKLGENDGVIAVNFYTAFIDSAVANHQVKSKAQIDKLLKEKKLKQTDTIAKRISTEYKKEHPVPEVDIERVVDHIDHIVKLIGIDHVAFGSDFDGVDGMLPKGLEDVSMYPNLIYHLLKRGYTEEDIEKICYKNIWRVWNRVEEVAKTN
ncbi:MAG TPA: dipeptidase [Cyclobacteriaceae bacterium]|jgi:membrane dipeptidase|nr:dipeptidase [Cyclobacteriaceae bacterium]